MPNLEKLIERLVQQSVDFVIVGGYAAMVHGAPYVTYDVDVCSPLTTVNLKRIYAAVEDLHSYHRMTPQQLPFVFSEGLERDLKNLYLATDLGQIDFLGSLPEVADYESVSASSIKMSLPFGECRILDLPTLIRSKEIVGRAKDLLVTAQLRAILDASQSS